MQAVPVCAVHLVGMEEGSEMTKKDYIKIAAALAQAGNTHFQYVPTNAGARLQYEACVGRLADTLAADNPKFDRARFYAACGVVAR